MKVLIPFYSMYGHIHRMAEAVAEGVKEVPGAEPVLRRVPETLSNVVLTSMGAARCAEVVLAHPGVHCGRASVCRRHHFWYADPLRKHVRSDARVSRLHWPTLDEGSPGGQGGQRVH